MAATTLTDLIIEETKETIFAFGLAIAKAVGLDTTTWRTGDPTLSTYHFVSEKLATLEGVIASFIRAGFLDYASGKMLRIHAKQQFGYDADEASYGTCTCLLTNASGGLYPFEIGDIVAKSSTTDKTYTNTTAGTLNGLGTLELNFTADEPGSDSNAGVGEIDELVTNFLGVTITNTTALAAQDEESEDSIKSGCKAKLGSLSAAGPAAAYEYVAKASALTGDTETTRVRVYPDSDTGDVLVILAGEDGAVSGTAVTAVEAGIVKWALPLTITPTVQSSINAPIDITYEIWVYERIAATESEVEETVEKTLEKAFPKRPIGGDIIPPATKGKIFADWVQCIIERVYPDDTFRVSMTDPSTDTQLEFDENATVGVVTATVHFIANP